MRWVVNLYERGGEGAVSAERRVERMRETGQSSPRTRPMYTENDNGIDRWT